MSEENNDTTGVNPQNELQNRVAKWLVQEGYPTEFETASIFRHHGFRVFQGEHFRDEKGTAPREIDVLAVADASNGEKPLIRCEFVVECKWSKDKLWIVFSSHPNLKFAA